MGRLYMPVLAGSEMMNTYLELLCGCISTVISNSADPPNCRRSEIINRFVELHICCCIIIINTEEEKNYLATFLFTSKK